MKKYVCLVLLTVVVALAACTDEQEISAIERTETSFSDFTIQPHCPREPFFDSKLVP